MRRLIALVTVLAGCAHVNIPVLDACGAKFLLATRSTRLQRTQRATKPTSILLYQHAPSVEHGEFMTALQNALEGVGHKVTLVTSEAALRAAASRQDSSVVMMHLDAARRLRADVSTWSPRMLILPMKAYMTKPEATRAKREFGRVLALPAPESQVVSMVQAAAG
jgi:hypothetical protein